jgi:hypothetical protein
MPRDSTGGLERATAARAAVVIEFLSKHPPRSAAQVFLVLHDRSLTRTDIDYAIDALCEAGVLVRNCGRLKASPALTMIDSLSLIDL